MADRWVFGTKNPHKLAEVQAMVGSGFLVGGLPEEVPEAPEPWASLHENALAKAAFYWQRLGWPVLAEDSGLFVPALGGQPGVWSARFGGPQELLEALGDSPFRGAYFSAVVVAYWGCGRYRFFTGYVAGRIGGTMRGGEGFGYDPVFIPDGEERTVAELGPEWKRRYSHRARAFLQVVVGLRPAS